jgi:capsular polysaccharide biosynthesis protein
VASGITRTAFGLTQQRDRWAPSTIELRGFMVVSLRAVAEHRMVLACMVFAAVTAGGASLSLRPPVYEATAQVIVTPVATVDAPLGMPVFRDLGDPIRTIETAAALLYTRRAAQLAAERLGGPWTADAVFDAITVKPRGQTNLVDVAARATRADAAAVLANSYAAAVLDLRSQALTAASTAALSGVTQQLNGSPVGSAAAEAARARFAYLELLRTHGDPSAAEAQAAVPPTVPSGMPMSLVLALSAAAGVLAAFALTVALPARTGARHGDAAGRPDVAAPVAHSGLIRQTVVAGNADLDVKPV